MTAVTTAPIEPPRHGGHFTRADLEAMPDDGRRYELFDGVLVVSPAPRPIHQRVAINLVLSLEDARPSPDYEVLAAPLDVALDDTNVTQPDVLVARRVDLTDRDLPTAPLLAVEVLSPSTRRFDLLLKRSWHEDAGTLAFWVVDPAVPSLRAWQLHNGRYVEAGHVQGAKPFTTDVPYPLTIVPGDLVGDRKFGG